VAASIKAIHKSHPPFDAVMTFYGMRYPRTVREQISNLLRTEYPSLYSDIPNAFRIPTGFPHCFHNAALIETVRHILFALESQRCVLLVEAEGCGLTQVARWAAEYYSKLHKKSRRDDDSFCFICTPETTIADWIGRLIPVPKADVGSDMIIWKNGPLTKAIIKGRCGVIDSIDAAPAKVSERLNALLDSKETKDDLIFEIPENTKNPIVEFHPDFRLIATCQYDHLEALSPALLNRFNIVYLDDQLENLTEGEQRQFIKHIFEATIDHDFKLNVDPKIVDMLYRFISIPHLK
jgi:hypothetical protein